MIRDLEILDGNIIKKLEEKVEEKKNERKWWKMREGARKASRGVLQISGNVRSYMDP